MKASIFIKTALVDQMQIIADAGLWFHLAKLIPSGVEVLARVNYAGKAVGSGGVSDAGTLELPLQMPELIKYFYMDFAPVYNGKYPEGKEFFAAYPKNFLTSHPEFEERHLTTNEKEQSFVHVPQWFETFKIFCWMIGGRIESGELADIDIFKTGEE